MTQAERPFGVTFAAYVLGIETTIAGALAALGLFGMLIGDVMGLFGFLVGGFPAAACRLASIGVLRGKAWGHVLAVIVLVGMAATIVPTLAGEPAVLEFIADPTSPDPLLIVIPFSALNAAAAIFLVRSPAREWFRSKRNVIVADGGGS